MVVARRVRWPVRLIPARREGAKAHGRGRPRQAAAVLSERVLRLSGSPGRAQTRAAQRREECRTVGRATGGSVVCGQTAVCAMPLLTIPARLC